MLWRNLKEWQKICSVHVGFWDYLFEKVLKFSRKHLCESCRLPDTYWECFPGKILEQLSQKTLANGGFYNYMLFYKQRFFFNSACCLTFSWIELQMLFRCCWIHITIIILKHILHLVCLCPCLGLRLFMSYLCDLFSFSASFSLPLNTNLRLSTVLKTSNKSLWSNVF